MSVKQEEKAWYQRSFTKEQFIEAWNTSTSYSGVARKLGAKPGRSTNTYKRCAESLGLGFSHMTGKAERLPHSYELTKKRPIDYYLNRGGPSLGSSGLRKRLIEEGLLPSCCQSGACPFDGVPVINPFTKEVDQVRLTLDHINGDHQDNRIENLRILCWHCHSMTETFMIGKIRQKPNTNPLLVCLCGESKTARSKLCKKCEHASRAGRPHKENNSTKLCSCGRKISLTAKICSDCFNLRRPTQGSRRVNTTSWPTIEEMLELRTKYSSRSLGEMFECSPGVIDRWIKKNGYHITRGKVTKL